MSKTFNAAKSLFNSTALSGNVGGQAREQTVLTPEWLLEAIRAVAPIGLDPCTTPENPTKAEAYMTEGMFGVDTPQFGQAGLAQFWATYPTIRAGCLVYVNPPYSDLRSWLAKCLYEASCLAPIYLLAPFRPQRKWFVEYTRGYTVASLAPFPFVGHKQAFPAPLCLVCYNLPVPNLGKYLTGLWRTE